MRIGITLPEEYRPSKMVICPGYTNVDKVFQIHVNVDGTVTVSPCVFFEFRRYEPYSKYSHLFYMRFILQIKERRV